ncbi:MAG: 30S ribosomal protein S19e [Thermoplasmatales archaeon]
MVNLKDVPPDMLIKEVSSRLKGQVVEPPWVREVKTGQHKERGPEDTDWYFIRTASVLRKIALNSPIGVESLSSEYGGKIDRGSARYHTGKGSRKIIRSIVQELERLGYVTKSKKGRSVSPAGTKILISAANEIASKLKGSITEIEKYI